MSISGHTETRIYTNYFQIHYEDAFHDVLATVNMDLINL